MPLTEFQTKLAKLLSKNRSEDSHLAGGAALHKRPNSIRYSEDLDYFHDSEKRVSEAFNEDQKLLIQNGYECETVLIHPGYIRCIVSKSNESTKIEWASDSSWRFMPTQKDDLVGYQLHPIDLVINKLLALAGRDEPRDFIDVIDSHENILPLGAQVWAACGKDPGLTPDSLMELIKRRGKYQQNEFDRLHLTKKVDVKELKTKWLQALNEAESFLKNLPPEDIGCLYYSKSKKDFVAPQDPTEDKDISPHFGAPGGVIPVIKPN